MYLDRSHPAYVQPGWLGHSVGWYEGDTLVIDTVGLSGARRFVAEAESQDQRQRGAQLESYSESGWGAQSRRATALADFHLSC